MTLKSSEKKQDAKSSPSASKKRYRNAIDDIFEGKKRKKVVSIDGEGNKSLDRGHGKGNKPLENGHGKNRNFDGVIRQQKCIGKVKNSKRFDEIKNEDAPITFSRKTADGYRIYTEEELGINKEDAGGTKLCPFDCDCCF